MKPSWGRVSWGLASVAISLGANLLLAPTFTRAYERAEYEAATGSITLQFDRKSSPVELPLANVHLITTSFAHVGQRYEVRELSLRAADDVLSTPRLQLFATLPNARGQDPGQSGHNAALLRGLELPLATAGFLGSQSAYFIVAHGHRSPVLSGALRFDEVEPPAAGQPAGAGQIARGTVQMQIETPDGLRSVRGQIRARLVWDAD
jgi:hypothetical protein